jgi:hypothetical protein
MTKVKKRSSDHDHALSSVVLREQKIRSAISAVKAPLLAAVQNIVEVNRKYWPLSVRQIHYRLLNDPPLCHSSKPDSVYVNTHIEVVVEKNTVYGILRPIAREFHLPVSSGRRHDMLKRFEASGKARLIMLLLSDFDPDGAEIAHSFARSMRDDFGLDQAGGLQVAVTPWQIRELNLPPVMTAKEGNTQYDRFVATYDTNIVHELEAIEPATLSTILREAILAAIDRQAFEWERRQEVSDDDQISRKRAALLEMLPRFSGCRSAMNSKIDIALKQNNLPKTNPINFVHKLVAWQSTNIECTLVGYK